LLPRINTRMSSLVSNASSLVSSTATVARKHSRISLVAASAAAAGMIGAVGVSAGVAPWAQASDNATKAVQVDSSLVTWGQSATHAASSLKTGKPVGTVQLEGIRAAGTGGSTGQAAPVVDAKHAAPVPQDAKVHVDDKVHVHAKVTKVTKAATARKAGEHRAVKRAVHQAARIAPKPYLIYDSVTPSSIPTGQHAAVYVNGAYAASANQASSHGSVLWIDTNGSDPNANVLDVEPGDATPAGAAAWAQQRLSEHPHSVAIIYTMRADWSEVKADVAGLPQWMQSHVHYWIADPTGVPHVVPGASATQWYWGNSYDLTTAVPGFEE
jgi:hypothetical protein